MHEKSHLLNNYNLKIIYTFYIKKYYYIYLYFITFFIIKKKNKT